MSNAVAFSIFHNHPLNTAEELLVKIRKCVRNVYSKRVGREHLNEMWAKIALSRGFKSTLKTTYVL